MEHHEIKLIFFPISCASTCAHPCSKGIYLPVVSLVPAGPRSLSAELLSGQFTVGVRGRKACRSQLGDTHTALWVHTHTDPSWLSPPSCSSHLFISCLSGNGAKMGDPTVPAPSALCVLGQCAGSSPSPALSPFFLLLPRCSAWHFEQQNGGGHRQHPWWARRSPCGEEDCSGDGPRAALRAPGAGRNPLSLPKGKAEVGTGLLRQRTADVGDLQAVSCSAGSQSGPLGRSEVAEGQLRGHSLLCSQEGSAGHSCPCCLGRSPHPCRLLPAACRGWRAVAASF